MARPGASPRDEVIQQLLRAAEQGQAERVIEILDDDSSVINERGTLSGHTGLRTALHFGSHSEPVVRALLERGADPNIRDEGDNAYPLHFVAERGDLAIARLLVEHGAQTIAGEGDDHHLDIIGWATCFPGVPVNRELVEYLLAHGARHTLFSATAVGDVHAIRARFEENPADLERALDRVIRKRHALHLAVMKKQPESLRVLLELGADPNSTDAAGLTPLDEAALSGETGMADLLLQAGARLTLASAVMLGREDAVERILTEEPDALRPGGRWATLIVKAAASGNPALVDSLIRRGASVDIFEAPEHAVDGTQGYTALHAAAFHGHAAVVDVLLRHGANALVREAKYGGTPAGWAHFANKHEAFERLMGAEIDIFDAILMDREDRIPGILERDPGALTRPFQAYMPPAAKLGRWAPPHDVTPLAAASAEGKVRAVRMLTTRGAELTAEGHAARTPEARVAAFLRMACIEGVIGGRERRHQMHAAARLLRKYPEIARDSIYTAVACGEVDEVRRLLSESPALASAPGGPRRWPPLLYLCTSRLPGHAPASDNAVAVARLLLDCGADPNASYAGGSDDIRYSALASVIGRGEEQTPTHPRAPELAALLLERGAEPYDQQVLYNAFGGHASFAMLAEDDLVWLLELMYQASIARGRRADWEDPEWRMLDMGGYGRGAWYLLRAALEGNHPRLARWILSHGASANPPRATDPRTAPGTLYEQAQRRGLEEFAELLAAHGATRAPAPLPSEPDLAARMFLAAEYDRVEEVQRLLDEGVSADVENTGGARPLHAAAYAGALHVVRLLIERGANVDPRDRTYGTTPIYWAWFAQRRAVVDLLTPRTHDVWALVPAGRVERLREVLAAEPRLARASWDGGTPLFDLPDDEQVAAEIVRLFLAHGADASFQRKDGATAAHLARARGLDAAAELLERG